MSQEVSNGDREISVGWFLGDEGELADYKRHHPWRSGDFDPQLARLFLEYIQIGLTDRQACLQVPMNEKWARTWGRGSKGSPDNYVSAFKDFAKPTQFEMMGADVVDISDGTDALANEESIIGAVYNPLADALEKSVKPNVKEYHKMVGDRVASRKWYVSKLASAKFGDKVQLDHGNAGGKAFKSVDFSKLSTEQLETLAKFDEILAGDK